MEYLSAGNWWGRKKFYCCLSDLLSYLVIDEQSLRSVQPFLDGEIVLSIQLAVENHWFTNSGLGSPNTLQVFGDIGTFKTELYVRVSFSPNLTAAVNHAEGND